MQTIVNERELPSPERQGVRREYIRSKCDPRVLIGGRTGDCFVRRDGAKWEWPGYKVELNSRDKPEVEPATGIEDTVRFLPDGEAETVDPILPKQKKSAA